MQVIHLPVPAFECVVQHMVMSVHLSKAVRFRLVCKDFDAEVRRAIFATNLFPGTFNKRVYVRFPRNVTIEYVRMWLMVRIFKPDLKVGHDRINSTIKITAQLLLNNTDFEGFEERRQAYIEILCDAVAHSFAGDITHLISVTESETHDGSSIADEDLIAAAAAVGDLAMIQRLLQGNCDPHRKSSIFGRPSENAARRGEKEILALLLVSEVQEESGDDPIVGIYTYRAFVAACRAGQQEIVESLLLVPLQASVSKIHDGFEAAAGNGHTALLKLLFPHTMEGSRKDILSRSLCHAARRGHGPATEYLLDSGANLNSFQSSGGPLHLAAGSGYSLVVRLLLDRGAESYCAGSRFGDPLFRAAQNGHSDVVQIFLDRGATLDDEKYNYTVLSRAARNGETAMVKYLLDKGIDLKAHKTGDRALEETAQWGHEDTVRLLVGLGVNVNGPSNHRDPPILRAMMYGQQHIVKLLLKLGAKEIDPLQTQYASKFQNGTYPLKNMAMACSQWGIPNQESGTG